MNEQQNVNAYPSKLAEEFSEEDNENVIWLQTNYPELAQEFQKIMVEQFVLFAKKHRHYGKNNITAGTNLETVADIKMSLTGLFFRMNDKINRFKNMIFGELRDKEEPLSDTFKDLSIYGIIAQIVQRKKFK